VPPAARQPGKSLIMRSIGLHAADAVTLTIRVTPEGSGTRATITARQPAKLGAWLDVKAKGGGNLADWLSECEAALTGRRDWPGQAVRPDVRAALAAPLPAGKTGEASASVLIAVPPPGPGRQSGIQRPARPCRKATRSRPGSCPARRSGGQARSSTPSPGARGTAS
jgi:hypothetical protein